MIAASAVPRPPAGAGVVAASCWDWRRSPPRRRALTSGADPPPAATADGAGADGARRSREGGLRPAGVPKPGAFPASTRRGVSPVSPLMAGVGPLLATGIGTAGRAAERPATSRCSRPLRLAACSTPPPAHRSSCRRRAGGPGCAGGGRLVQPPGWSAARREPVTTGGRPAYRMALRPDDTSSLLARSRSTVDAEHGAALVAGSWPTAGWRGPRPATARRAGGRRGRRRLRRTAPGRRPVVSAGQALAGLAPVAAAPAPWRAAGPGPDLPLARARRRRI